MQPYIFPYIGYFQLIGCSDVFVFYDDVQYVKNSWVNRNRILLQGRAYDIVFPVTKKHSHSLIIDVKLCINEFFIDKFFRRLHAAYAKAPFYRAIHHMLKTLFSEHYESVSDMAIAFIHRVDEYLGLNNHYLRSSEIFSKNSSLAGTERVIAISKALQAHTYVNSRGGKHLYKGEIFSNEGLHLKFLHSSNISYKQFNSHFVPDLSMIDVLMFNSPIEVKRLLGNYSLE